MRISSFFAYLKTILPGSALPRQSTLRNLTLVVGQHYTSENIFLQNIDILTTHDGFALKDYRYSNTKTARLCLQNISSRNGPYKLYCELQINLNLRCFLSSPIQLSSCAIGVLEFNTVHHRTMYQKTFCLHLRTIKRPNCSECVGFLYST